MSSVSFENVSGHFGNVHAIDQVDLQIQAGEFFAMLGPSGSGKTACLRQIAGFEHPTNGVVKIFGNSVAGVSPYQRQSIEFFRPTPCFHICRCRTTLPMA